MTETDWSGKFKRWYEHNHFFSPREHCSSVKALSIYSGIPENDLKQLLDGNISDLNNISRKNRKKLYSITNIKDFRVEFEPPEFKGKEIIIDGERRQIGLIEGNFREEVLDEYQFRFSNEYSENDSLYYDIDNGSNSFIAVLVNSIIRKFGFRTATPADIERMWEQKAIPDNLKMDPMYSDTAIILKTQCGENESIAQHLAKQIKYLKGKVEYPSIIPLAGLDLEDINSEASRGSGYGLSFKIREDTQIIHSPYLPNHQVCFNQCDENGLPIINNSGSRIFFSQSRFGVTRMNLCNRFCINTSCQSLKSSSYEGCLFVVGPAKRLEQNNKEIQR